MLAASRVSTMQTTRCFSFCGVSQPWSGDVQPSFASSGLGSTGMVSRYDRALCWDDVQAEGNHSRQVSGLLYYAPSFLRSPPHPRNPTH